MSSILFLRFKFILPRDNICILQYSRLEVSFDFDNLKFDSNLFNYYEEERLVLLPKYRAIAVSRTRWFECGLDMTKIIKSSSVFIDNILNEHCVTSDQYYYFKKNLSDVSESYVSDDIIYSFNRIADSSYHSILTRFWPQYVPLE